MSSVPAVSAPDGAALGAAKPTVSLAGDAFSDLLGAAGEQLVPAAAESNGGEGAAAPAPQGALAALAAMLASVTAIKGSHRSPASAKAADKDPSSGEVAPGKDREPDGGDNAGGTGAPALSAGPCGPADPAPASADRAEAPGAGAPPQLARAVSVTAATGHAIAATGVSGVSAEPAAGAGADRPVATSDRLAAAPRVTSAGPGAAAPVPAAAAGAAAGPGTGAAPGAPPAAPDPFLGRVLSLVQRDERPDAAREPRAVKADPVALPPAGAAPFLHSPASGAPEAAGGRHAPAAIDQSVAHHLDLAREGEWLDQLAGDIARSAGQSGTLRFRLHPEALGRLHVELSQGAAGASIRLTTDTESARSIIADAQPRLVAEARAHGVRIAETHVALGAGGQGSSPGQHGQRQAADPFLRTSGAGSPDAGGAQPPASPGAAAGEERYA